MKKEEKKHEHDSAYELISQRRARIFLEEAINYLGETHGKEEAAEILMWWIEQIMNDQVDIS